MTDVQSEPKYSIATSDYRCDECTGEVACEATFHSAIFFEAGELRRRNYCKDCWHKGLKLQPGAADEGGGERGAQRPTPGGAEVFAFWRTRRPAAPTDGPRKVRFDPQFIFEFFLRLGDERQDAVDAERDGSAEIEPGPDAPDLENAADASLVLTAAEAESGGGLSGVAPCSSERDQLRFFLGLLLIRKKVLKFKSSVDREGAEWLLVTDRQTPPKVHEVLNPGLTESQLDRLKDRIGELLQMRL